MDRQNARPPDAQGDRGGRFAELSSRSENMSRAYLGLWVALPMPSISATQNLAGGVMLFEHPPSLWERNVLADASYVDRRSHVDETPSCWSTTQSMLRSLR